MKKPDQKAGKYYQGHIFLDRKYLADIDKYIDYLQSKLKERGKLLLDFAKQLEKDKRLKTKFELEYIVNQFLTKN